jgi:hypothetical protein
MPPVVNIGMTDVQNIASQINCSNCNLSRWWNNIMNQLSDWASLNRLVNIYIYKKSTLTLGWVPRPTKMLLLGIYIFMVYLMTV